jgi:hypothetical protein
MTYLVEISQNVNSRAQELLTRAHGQGVVVDFVAMTQRTSAPSSLVHQQSLLLGVCHASERRGILPPSDALPLAEGRMVTTADFFGPAFDSARQRLLMPVSLDVQRSLRASEHPENLVAGPYTWTDQDNAEDAVWYHNDSAPASGYAFFFTQPPHGLAIPHSEVQSLFIAINDSVLGNPSDDSEIWQWDVNDAWAEYFEDGAEWWGTAAWTIRVSKTSLVVVLASATD